MMSDTMISRMARPLIVGVAVIAALCSGASQAAAQSQSQSQSEIPRFIVPVDCQLGQDCWFMKYADTDPRPNQKQDYRCGHMVTDDHSGTDFAVTDMSRLASGVGVLAAADGEVMRIRTSMKDGPYRPEGPPEGAEERGCGNYVILHHGKGLNTHYCHLKWGSIVVKPGDKVRQGDQIALMGYTGLTAHPHLHFGVEMRGRVIDPMTGLFTDNLDPQRCRDQNDLHMWTQTMPYKRISLFNAGVSDGVPNIDQIRAGQGGSPTPSAESDAIVLWFDSFGIRRGDSISWRMVGPDGKSLVINQDRQAPRTYARYHAFEGLRRPPTGWGSGTYTAQITIKGRDGMQDSRRFSFKIR
ncbi:MAG: M23 family metallopeptidase [Alphaproteobacteria bacterium]